MIRRLTHDDDDLLREVLRWDEGRPEWYQAMDAVFNRGTADDFVALLDDPCRVLVGVFNSQLEAVIIVELKDYGVFESHLCAKRGAGVGAIVEAAQSLLYDLLQFDLQELYVWVAEKHISVKRLCSMIPLRPDGIIMYKGSYRGRLIKWIRYSVQREQLVQEKAA